MGLRREHNTGSQRRPPGGGDPEQSVKEPCRNPARR